MGAVALTMGCGDSSAADGDTATSTSVGQTQTGTTTGVDTTGSSSASNTGATSTSGNDTSTSTMGGPKFDLAPPDAETGGVVPTCKVVDDMDAIGPCTDEAPPDSFEPDVQWSWMGENGFEASSTVPLVANLTDDNDDGEIDLCDTPDIVVVAWPGGLFALDGETGTTHWEAPVSVRHFWTPALGDIDDDGVPEIVTVTQAGELVAVDSDGSILWTSAADYADAGQVGAVAMADLDADGDVEIFLRHMVADHLGNLLWTSPVPAAVWSATTAADLDGDDDMEVIVGAAAYHHDGTLAFPNPGLTDVYHGLYPQVADLDDDPEPEILVAASDGLAVLEHDGGIKYSSFNGTGDSNRPVNIHDFDGDGVSEFAASFPSEYAVYEADTTLVWSANIQDASGQAGGTAFDFLGAGVAQAMYADESTMYAFDDMGGVLMQVPRSSLTQIEYPVVADVDNDGSAEVVVMSNPYSGGQTAPTIQVIRDAEDRWIPARRIWNQHTYHVTNVREDGTIPQVEPKHWTLLNTFRTQAQISAGGGVCMPEPEG